MSELLVLGNGFDLKAGAKTKYSHYFNSKSFEEKKAMCIEWIDKCRIQNNYPSMLLYTNMARYQFNCWDLLFCAKSLNGQLGRKETEEVDWCDIESEIFESLVQNKTPSLWDRVYSMLEQYHKRRVDPYQIIRLQSDVATNSIFSFIAASGWAKNMSKDEFYEKLLDELKVFEVSFGLYILEATISNEYEFNARDFANKLASENREIQIDSFNYSDFSNNIITIRNINGGCKHPIFGIDLKSEDMLERKNLMRFTKTDRRIHQDAYKLSNMSKVDISPIDKAVVFGHSLNEMDYDYFTFLFTALRFNTLEICKMGSIRFVYTVYDANKETEIRNDFARRVHALVDHYEEYIGKPGQHILLNMLRFSGKLVIAEI